MSGYAKNALKQYVPQLCGDSYDADELYDDHQVKFTNEGIRLDHQPQNHYEWYVKIPHHEDYRLWLPAAPNPEQRPWLEALHAGDAELGECRLLEREGKWYVHVTATREVETRSASDPTDQTPVGVDIGMLPWPRCVTVTSAAPDRSRHLQRRSRKSAALPQDVLHRHSSPPAARE